jgi:hypothetical protein
VRRQTLACVDGLLQEVAQSDASRVHLRFVKTAGMGIFGASIESIHVPVCFGGLDITAMACLLACSSTRADSLTLQIRSRYNGEMIFQQSTPRGRPVKIPMLVKTPGCHH